MVRSNKKINMRIGDNMKEIKQWLLKSYFLSFNYLFVIFIRFL